MENIIDLLSVYGTTTAAAAAAATAEQNKFSTTFYADFTIADRFGVSAVRDTFNRAFDEWKDDFRYLTDLVIVLNHKIWQHYESGNVALSRLYDQLWRKADEYAWDTLQGDQQDYYFRMTD